MIFTMGRFTAGSPVPSIVQLILLVCASVLVVTRAEAQTVSGAVLLADSSTIVAGAIVVASDSSGKVTRALTSASGQFTLRLSHAGRYSLQVLRIGFRATPGPTIDVSVGDTVAVRLIAASARVSLAAVTVRARSQCRVRPDTSLLVARVWEEARKAMIATQLSSAPTPLLGEWISYSRMLDSSGQMVREQHVRSVKNQTTTVFRSVSAASLANVGYVVDDSSGTSFHAPDAAVLLSEQFVATHCFRLSPSGSNDSSLIGIEFEPTSSRRAARDITGTVWVERSSAELKFVEFAYANLPATAVELEGGGTVEFTRLGEGSWIVSSWQAQLPVFERGVTAQTRAFGEIFLRTRQRVRGVQVTGGEVSRISRGDSTLFERVGASARLQLISMDSLVPTSGASIALEGTNYIGTTDASGFVMIGPLPAGRYRASVVIPRLDSLFARPSNWEVVAGRSGTTDTLDLPSARDWLAKSCAQNSTTAGFAILRGVVRDSVFMRTGVSVSLTFSRVDGRALRTGVARWRDETLTAETDARGRWQFCGLPHETDLKVHAASVDGTASQIIRLDPIKPYPFVELELRTDSISLQRAKSPRPRTPLP